MKKIILLSAFIATFFSTTSCDNTTGSNDLDVSRVNYIHTINGVSSVNLLANSIKINATSLAYKAQRGYTNIASGNTNIKVQSTATTPVDYINTDYNFLPFKNYSVFATGSTTNPIATTEAVVVEDDLTAPQSGNYRLRVANMVSNSTTLNVEIAPVYTAYVKSTNAPVSPAENYIDATSYNQIFSNVAYKKVSDFSELSYIVSKIPTHTDPNKIYKATGLFSIKVTNGTTSVITFNNSSIAPGRNFTLLLSGLLASTSGTVLGN